ncbi:ABC transporter substrate-binding protein [Konateibacter massiliensis]|uniref:ABC transporter substrate-binding protein n=1 Tax=Konateibacter massiliensis TaxID=2002841 RepID=UPI000C158C11|nr:ABC transporter substrate-binding protein [Konateibacter massiliensis]
MKKKILSAALTLLIAVGAAGCAGASGSSTEKNTEAATTQTTQPAEEKTTGEDAVADTKEPVTVRLAIDTAAGGSFQVRVANKQGYFEDYGIDAQISNFAYGIDTINALLVGQSDTASGADYALINSLGKGDLVVVSSLSQTNDKSAEKTLLFVKGDISTASDLKGKKLGVQKGTVYEYIWAKYLETNGIAESEIEYVPFSTPDEAIVSLQNGDMDAVWIGGALATKFEQLEGVKVLGNVLDSGVNISAYLLLERSFVEENPEAVAGVLKAIYDGMNYIPGHEEETAKLAFEELKLPEESVLEDLKYTNYALGFSQEDFDHLEDIKKWSEEHGILTDQYDLKDKINVTPLQNSFPELLTYEP